MRTLIVVIGLIGIWLGWFVNSATRQQKVVRAILARGGTVAYDYQYDANGRRLPNGKSSYPGWLHRYLDDNYFHDVIMVGIDVDAAGSSLGATNEDLAHLERLHKLKFLYLGDGRIKDDGLAHLQQLTELRLLMLWRNPISGEGLKHLSRLKKLQHLDLSETVVTDDQLIYLKDLTGLERIDLAGNPQLTGSFLQHAADLPNLKSLVLRKSGIADSALVHFARAKKLQSLILDSTQVTDTGMVHLLGLKSLTELDLNVTAVSDAAIAKIEEMFPQASVQAAATRRVPQE